MELWGTAFKVGNDKYDEKQITIESNFLNSKEKRLLEGLALIISAYKLSPNVVAGAVKERNKRVWDSMEKDPRFWLGVYSKEELEHRINFYKELASELSILNAML